MNHQSSVSWKCPSNIALVKYWGKHGRQLPRNPSISFTLNNAHTTTKVDYEYNSDKSDGPQLEFYFENEAKPEFESKILKFLNAIKDVLPIVEQLKMKIYSSNSFPHSSGIASSASSMAALSMCLLDIEKEVLNLDHIDLKKASLIARLGSGSASRSIFPHMAVWGKHNAIKDSSDEWAIAYTEGIQDTFLNFHDDILIVSNKEKSVSSRAGHALMENNPYSSARFNQANEHMVKIIQAMQSGDYQTFGNIVEKEALTLHALMMSSDPPYILMEPETLHIIKAIQDFRKEQGIPVYFTLDAGPNIHLLYPDEVSQQVATLKTYLKDYCFESMIIEDHVGKGPEKVA